MEIETTGDQEDDGFDRGDASEATRTPFGGLEQAVDGLQKPIGLPRLSLVGNTLPTKRAATPVSAGKYSRPTYTRIPFPQWIIWVYNHEPS